MSKILSSLLLACLLGGAGTAIAAAYDQEMREAARLLRGGETARAAAIWQRWAAQEQADAAFNLGQIYLYGDGVGRDEALALSWYRRAAELGDKPAQLQVGLMYLNGQGVAADPEEAQRWFTQHRRHHLHHEQSAQMQAWRQQAAQLIEQRDHRENLLAGRRDGARVVAELRRRAGLPVQQLASAD